MSIPKWNEIASDERFIQASQQEQAKIRNNWADDFLRLRDEGDFDLDDKQVSELLTKNGWQPGQVVTALSRRKQERADQLKQDKDLIMPDVRNLLMEKAAHKDGMPLLAGSVADDVELGFQRVAGTALKSLDFLTGGSIDGLHQAQKEHDAYVRWIDATSQTNTAAVEGWKEDGLKGFLSAVFHSSLRELPSFALQIGLGAASGGLATGFMGLSSAADKWADIVDDDSLSFRQKAAMIGIHSFYEMVMEQLNTLPLARRLGSKAQGAMFREMARNKAWGQLAKKVAKQIGGNIFEEGAEEFLTQLGQDLSDSFIRNGEITEEDRDNALRNATEAFIGGAAMGAVGVGFESASYLPVDAATSRKYFQQQLGGNLPEKYASKAARQKALDDYELHGSPITAGEPTANDKALAFAERLNAYNHMDDEQRKQYEPYVQEWRDGFDAAMDEKIKEDRMQTIENFDAYRNRVEGEMFTPVTEEGKPVEVVETKEEEEKPTVTETVTEPVTNETVTETVTEKPAEPPKEEPKQEPKEEPKAQEWTWTAEHPNHEKAPGGHVIIVNMNDVITDRDKGAIAGDQNRRVGAEREAQVNEMARNPVVDKMFVNGRTDEGMPVAVKRVAKDENGNVIKDENGNPKYVYHIISGNGRLWMRRLMRQFGTDTEYLSRLSELAGQHNAEYDKNDLGATAIRLIDEELTDEQTKDFVRQANMEGGGKLGLDAAERAADDAAGMEKHGDELIGLFRELDNDSIVSASNKEFITKFRDLIGKRDGDVDSNGNPTDQFEKRVANAFLGMLFKNMPVKERSDLLNRLVNHADKYGVVGLYRALAKKSPKLIKLETANKDYGLTDILPNVLDALMDFKANREQFKNDPEMYLNQPRLDGKQLNVDERELFKILAGAKSMAQAARLLQSYVDKARQEISSPLLFGVVRNRGELLMAVNNAAEEITQGGTAADAYLENGTLEDVEVPLVEGSVIVTDEKPRAKRSLVRRTETETQEAKAHADEIGKAAKDVANNLGYDVIVHDTDADLPADVQEDMVAFGDGAVAEAWNDNGVIHLVASRLESSADAVKKVLHEIVGHSGLAALFKGRFNDAWDNMVENLWEHHRADILERCKDYLEGNNVDTQTGRSELVEEWLARLAETKRKPMWWKTVKSRIRQLLRMLPGLHDLAISDAEIEQMLADAATAVRQASGKVKRRYSISNLWTGSAADYDKPSLHYIGTGEGAQAFGWGLYASDQKGIAEHYAKDLAPRESPKIYIAGKELKYYYDGGIVEVDNLDSVWPSDIEYDDELLSDIFEHLKFNDYNLSQTKEDYKNYIERGEKYYKDRQNTIFGILDKLEIKTTPNRNLYRQTWFTNRVNEGEANLLDWNGRITNEQIDLAESQIEKENYKSNVKYLLREAIKDARKKPTQGRTFYSTIAGALNMEPSVFGNKKKAASEFLYRAGIDGIKYPAASGGMGDGSSGWNYVSFSDTNMRVDEHIRYSMVKEGTQPLPSGPEPSMAGILQRAAKSPIDTRHLHALRLPLIMELAKQLGSNPKAVDRIAVMGGMAKGVFYEGQERLIKVIRSLVAPHQLGQPIIAENDMVEEQIETIKEYWKGRGIPEDEIEIIENEVEDQPTKTKIVTIWHDKSQAMLRKTLAHEVGHLIDYNAGETTSHGNVLGTVGGIVKGYLLHTIAESPENWVDWKKRKRELFEQAKQTFGECPEDENAKKKWFRKVNAEYRRLIVEECDKNNMFRVETIRDELIQNSKWWRGEWGEDDPNYARYRKAPTELFADAMSILLNAPDKFMEQLPETWRMLQNYQSQREDFHKAWQGMMRLMENEDAYAEALDKLADAGYTADENTYREIVKDNNNLWLDFCSLFHQFSYIKDAAMKLVKSGEVKFDDTPLAPIVAKTHMTEQTLYLAKAQRFVAPLNKVGIDNHTIGKYLEWKRIVNDPKINKGHIINPNGMTVYDAEDALNGLHKKLGDEKWQMLEDWHKKLWQLRQEFVIDLAEKSGAYTKELITQMRENEWYSYRAVIEKIYGDNGKEKASSGLGQIYGLKGTLDPIANPLGWTYEHDIMLMRGIRENMARRSTVEFMKRYFPELIERVSNFSPWNKSTPPAGWSNLVVLENGKPVTYRIVKNWASGFEPNMLINGPVGRVIYHPVVQFPLNLFRRSWTTFAATFMMGNPIRDYRSSVLNLGGIAPNVGIWEFTKQWAKGMKESFGFEFMDDFKTAKKIMESAFGIKFRDNIDDFPLMEDALRRNILQPERGYDRVNELGGEVGDKSEELFRRYGVIESRNPKWDKWEKIDRLGLVYKYANFIEKITTSFERGAKLGGLLALKNAGMSEGEVNYNVSKNIGSPDFQDRGILTPLANTVFIFSNASIQGMSSIWNSIKVNPKALAARFMTTVGTAVTIQWLLESGVLRNALLSMYGGDKDKAEENILYRILDWMQKMYGKITHYNRYHFQCMPIPFTEQEDGSVFMLRIPYAENAKLPAMIMHAALDAAHTDIEKDKNLMNETVDALLGQGLNLNPVIKGGMDVGTMLAGNNPYDYYRGRQAVKYSEWEAGGLRRFKGATSYLYNQYSPVSQLKYDTRDPYLAFNLFAQISGIGAFIKPQKYGEAEQNKVITKKNQRRKLSGKTELFFRKAK